MLWRPQRKSGLSLLPICLALGLAGTDFGSAAGAGWSARIWQSDDGLPGNNVTGVAQTSDGYLWLSTHNGLTRFDGQRFQIIELPIPSGRKQPMIREMVLGRGDELWLAMEGGLVVSIGPKATNVFTSTNGLPLMRPVSMAQDRAADVWVGYADGSVCQIRGGRVARFTTRDGLEGLGACTLSTDLDGQLWFAKAGRVGLFRNGQFEVRFQMEQRAIQLGLAREGGLWICAGLELWRCRPDEAPVRCGRLPTDRVAAEPTAVFEDRSGGVWIGTSVAGLFRFGGTNFLHIPTSHEEILCLGGDREENLWVGTGGGGLNRLRPRVVELQTGESGLPSTTVRSICEDQGGGLWAVVQSGEVVRWSAGRWRTLTGRDGWPGVRANCVTSDGAGGVWIGTYHGGLLHWRNGLAESFDRKSGLAGDVMRGLLVDHRGDLWIALESPTGLQRLRAGKFQTIAQPNPSRAIRAMAEDTAGRMWLGTQDGFLFQVQDDGLIDRTPRTLSPPKPIRCLSAFPDGSVWIGYAGAGLGRMKDGRFAQVGVEQGLQDANICAVTADQGGGVWCAADHGIFQVRQRELDAVAEGKAERVRSVVFGRDEGLSSLQGSYGYAPGLLKNREGRLYFPMRTGLAVVDPRRTPANRLPPPIVIERLLVDGHEHPVAPNKPCLVPPTHRKLEVDFTALSFVAPENVRFRHRLVDWDEGWIETAAPARSVSYPRLPAGRYEFQVRACNNAGVWNEEGKALAFIVRPFFWQQAWFRVGGLAVFGLGVAALVRYASFRRLRSHLDLLEREASLQRERARIAKDIHDDLGASLTEISLLGKLAQQDLNEPATAQAHLLRISAAAREGVKAVDEIVWAVNPRNDTLAHLLDYAGQFAVDFLKAAGVRCRVDFPEPIPACAVAGDTRHSLFLVVKEALNNVVKHSAASEVWVRARLKNQNLVLSVEDNGQGFAGGPANACQDGLRNMQQRLAELGGTCRVASAAGEGTKVFVEVALNPPPRIPGSGAKAT